MAFSYPNKVEQRESR